MQQPSKQPKMYRFDKFKEFGELNRTNGKLFYAPSKALPLHQSPALPSLSMESLPSNSNPKSMEVNMNMDMERPMQQRCEGHISLLFISCTQFGLNMLPSWSQPFLKHYQLQNDMNMETNTNKVNEKLMNIKEELKNMNEKDMSMEPKKLNGRKAQRKKPLPLQLLTLSLNEAWYWHYLHSHICQGLQQFLPSQAHNYVHFGACNSFRTHMNMYNSYVGYVYLIDAKGNIRWR